METDKKEIPHEPGFHEIESELVIRGSTVGTEQIQLFQRGSATEDSTK